MLSYTTTTFHYPLERVDIEYNGKYTFYVYTLDMFHIRDKRPLETIKNYNIKRNDLKAAKSFCDNYIKEINN